MGNACGSDDDLARHGDPLDTIDAKAHAAGYDLPALLDLGVRLLTSIRLRFDTFAGA
jgi:hypothetical protein